MVQDLSKQQKLHMSPAHSFLHYISSGLTTSVVRPEYLEFNIGLHSGGWWVKNVVGLNVCMKGGWSLQVLWPSVKLKVFFSARQDATRWSLHVKFWKSFGRCIFSVFSVPCCTSWEKKRMIWKKWWGLAPSALFSQPPLGLQPVQGPKTKKFHRHRHWTGPLQLQTIEIHLVNSLISAQIIGWSVDKLRKQGCVREIYATGFQVVFLFYKLEIR